MIYAQINEENICTVISDMGEVEVSDKHLIPIETYDTSLLGKKYNNGVWEDMPQPEPQPSQLDRIEESLKTSFSEAQQTAIDKYTEELLEGGIL